MARDIFDRMAVGNSVASALHVGVFHSPFDYGELILSVVDRVLVVESDLCAVSSGHEAAEFVECRDLSGPGGFWRDDVAQPFDHLSRRLVGEGDGKDSLGIYFHVLDQVGDALDDDSGFPRPWACDDEDRSLGRGDGLSLLGIKAREYAVERLCHDWSSGGLLFGSPFKHSPGNCFVPGAVQDG